MPEVITDLRNLKFQNKKRVWKPFMEKYNCQIICELGIRNGDNFDLLIEHQPTLAIAIDIWKDDVNTAINDAGFSQEILDRQYVRFRNKMQNKAFVKIFREFSAKAAKYFPDNSFDFIYIDADHSYNGCLADLKNWYPKVKKGKFLLGDDYRSDLSNPRVKFGVVRAVNKFIKDMNLTVYELPRYGWAIIKP